MQSLIPMEKLLSQFLFHFQATKRSFYAFISFLFLCLLAYNSASIFCTHLPFPPREMKEVGFLSIPSSAKLKTSSVLNSLKEDNPISKLTPLLHKNPIFMIKNSTSTLYHHRRRRRRRRHRGNGKAFILEDNKNPFEDRVMEFFNPNSSVYSCELRFFMTWISSLESFGNREVLAMESLFKVHPNGCLIIASNSLDSDNGSKILRPFWDRGFRVAAVSPDFKYLFRNTAAESWYNQLMQGNINTGEVNLGQNLSNLLRLGLLYKFGGIYVDTDVIILRSFGEIRNAIGAQTSDDSGKWSRLNNAVMVFDEGHPLVYKFIEEFALTFDGNKWGHNGPYLVSRVVSRLSGRPNKEFYNFTVLPPVAFYPVDWSKIGRFFEGPKGLSHSKWLIAKLKQIRDKSFAVHLWNKHTRGFEIEKGSIIQHLMMSSCVFCNSSSSALL